MKKLLLSVLVGILGITGLSAQCLVQIFPLPGHVKVITNQTINGTGTVYWVCDGVDVIVASSAGSIFVLEANATITFNGSSGDLVYGKPGCVITNNTIEDIAVIVNPANVTLTNNSSGSITIAMSCNPVIYDYSLVGGSSGCTSGIEETVSMHFSVFPQPAVDELNFSASFTGVLSLYRVDGVLVQSQSVEKLEKLNVKDLTEGVYFLWFGNQPVRFIK